MKPKDPNEIEIRTANKKLLVCTIVPAQDGSTEIITRQGKKEDRMDLADFLKQAKL